MATIGIVYALLFALSTTSVLLSWALVTAVGGRVTEVDLGGLPPLVKRRLGGVQLKLGLFIGGSVTIAGRAEPAPDDPRSWERLGLGRRLLALLGPWLVSIAIIAACLGPTRGLTSIGHGVQQLLFVLDPTPLVHGFVALVDTAPLRVVLGVATAKFFAGNLLPLPMFGLWSVVSELGRRSGPPPSTHGSLMIVGALVWLWMYGRFAYAIVRVAL